MRAIWRTWLLALALLWAQTAAAQHALSHLQADHDDGHPACEWCTAYGSVQLGAAPSLPPAADPEAVPAPLPAHVPAAAAAAPWRPYRSRAPPLTLV
ncbi:MAG: hypothetical protein NZ524_05420 [Thiobacillaceae bacterium]|nr:hypothetical protein [Thiobacillaceae bacterium]MCX7674174.1 hypothetical protein [Thiobacillaceae bacterium]MDW8322888.1 hypothetical protein [Burkholderiales bacterium]